MTRDIVASMPGLRELWQQTRGDPDIRIAVLDGPADLSHPSFAGAMVAQVVPASGASVGSLPRSTHGTHVASIIFGQHDGPIAGVAPRCHGIVIPVYTEDEQGELVPCSQTDLARAISLALQHGAHVINISGGELTPWGEAQHFLANAIRQCSQQNVLVVAATGNEGCECLQVPAALPTVLAVGAADDDGRPLQISNWSGRLAAHGILAPGFRIPGASPNDGTVEFSGTSFAAPIVSGVAALLLSLEKQRGEQPNPQGVRDALIRSAIPCTPEESAECSRILAGRLNVRGAYDQLFGSPSTTPNSVRTFPLYLGRSPPDRPQSAMRRVSGIRVAQFTGPSQTVQFSREDIAMPTRQNTMQPQANEGIGVPVHPQAIQNAQQNRDQSPDQVSPAVGPCAVDAGQVSVTSQAEPVVEPAAMQPTAFGAGCGCGAGQGPEASSAPVSPQQPTASSQQPMMAPPPGTVPQQQSAMPLQQRSLPSGQVCMPAGPGIAPVPQQRIVQAQEPLAPMGGGVRPSQNGPDGPGSGNLPLAAEFITSRNSQLVFVICELSYDFGTDARRDYFVQRFFELRQDEAFLRDNNLTADELIPENQRAMAAYISNPPAGRHPEDAERLIFTGANEQMDLYAFRPLRAFAPIVLLTFSQILRDQAEGKSDRMSISGRIIGDITLYNGERVPVVDPSLSNLFNWKTDVLSRAVLDAIRPPEGASEEEKARFAAREAALQEQLNNFLERIYYELRNLGQSPPDRAINYFATNAFSTGQVFSEALAEELELDTIRVEQSPFCRPYSECYDVIMTFFNPRERLTQALREWRIVVDTSDVGPVSVGRIRRWSRFA
jgi:cyanobactin maturation PatA/PatG family protease